MSIKYRFFALVCVFAMLALCIVMVSMKTMREYDTIMGQYRTAYENALRGERLNRLVSSAVMESRGIYLSETPEESRQFADNLNVALGQIEAMMRTWQADTEARELGLTPALIAEVKGFTTLRRELARLGRENNMQAATDLGVTSRSERKALQEHVDALTASMKAHLILTETRLEAYKADRKRDFLLMACAGIAVMVLACLVMVKRYIQEPLQALANSIIRISEGDYAVPIPKAGTNSDISLVWNAVSVLKDRSIEVERLHREEHLAEMKLRELTLD